MELTNKLNLSFTEAEIDVLRYALATAIVGERERAQTLKLWDKEFVLARCASQQRMLDRLNKLAE